MKKGKVTIGKGGSGKRWFWRVEVKGSCGGVFVLTGQEPIVQGRKRDGFLLFIDFLTGFYTLGDGLSRGGSRTHSSPLTSPALNSR